MEEKRKNNFTPIKHYKRVPGVVYRWLHNILHVDEINSFMLEHGHLRNIDFIDKVIEHFNITFEYRGMENIGNDRYIIVCNHPLGGFDGLALLSWFNKNKGWTQTLSNDFLMNVKPLTELFVPINKVGRQQREAIRKVEELYESDAHILIFPAGLCSRKSKGEICDLEWQKHFIQKSIQYNIDVLPIYFEGKNSKRFYRIAQLRKFFKIKINIEMMYLVDELVKHRNGKFKIFFGSPLPAATFNKTKTHMEWAQHVKNIVYTLK